MTRLTKKIECVVAGSTERKVMWPLRAELAYDPRDPFAVTIEFQTKSPVTWQISRELLAEGVVGARAAPVGVGDVRVGRETEQTLDGLRDEVRLELTSPTGHSCLWLPAAPVEQFLDATFRTVPAGGESSRIDWNAWLRTTLAEEQTGGQA